jgi:hypothetical protein
MHIAVVGHTSKQVQFTCTAGNAVATWMGSEPPPLGATVDVEFGIDKTLPWTEISRVHEEPGLAITGGRIRIRGKVEAVDEGGVLTLTFHGTPVLIDTTGPPPVDIIGAVVELPDTPLAVYPTTV